MIQWLWMNINSLSGRMIISHVLVAILTFLLTLFLTPALRAVRGGYDISGYRAVAMNEGMAWMFQDVIDPTPHYPQTAGFTIVVSETDEVIFVIGDTPCNVNEMLANCAPNLVNATGETSFERNGTVWSQVVLPAVTGQTVISQRAPYDETLWQVLRATLNPQWIMRVLSGEAIIVFFLSLPLALFVVWLLLRPKIRRVEHVVETSKRFAAGDLTARAIDNGQDDVGEWAARFNDMAEALAQNIIALRYLALRNNELIREIEQSAIQQERLRLSRDLHDSVAQHLFSLTVSTRNLPTLLKTDPERSLAQAKIIAEMAQQTLLELRALLVNLRPTNIIHHGLADALRKLCEQYSASHSLSIDCSVMLFGADIPKSVEDTLYRITQEALSNVAKHAQASEVAVSLVQGQKQINLSISDDGTGTINTQNKGMGLHTMRERAIAIGGEFEIDSVIDHGTTVRVRLPLIESEPIAQ